MSTQINVSESSKTAKDKVSRYKWQIVDKPGKLQSIHKNLLKFDYDYQRDPFQKKVYELSNTWSWVAAGVITVGARDGEYWVIDGQHRVLAAKRRSDIELLPCIVFQTEDASAEARGFLMANAMRKPVNTFAKHKAMLVAEDPIAVFVEKTCEKFNLRLSQRHLAKGGIRAVNWCYRRAKEDKEAFVKILGLCAQLAHAQSASVNERLLDGLWYINRFCGDGLDDPRLVKRIKDKGAEKLLAAAQRAAAYYGRGGGKVLAEGIINEINKGLQYKYVLSTNADDGEEVNEQDE